MCAFSHTLKYWRKQQLVLDFSVYILILKSIICVQIVELKKIVKIMAEALDENSINTDVTFESGDENVCVPRIPNKQLILE